MKRSTRLKISRALKRFHAARRARNAARSRGVKRYWKEVRKYQRRLKLSTADTRRAMRISREEEIPVEAAANIWKGVSKLLAPTKPPEEFTAEIPNVLDLQQHLQLAARDGRPVKIDSPFFTWEGTFSSEYEVDQIWKQLKAAGDQYDFPGYTAQEKKDHYWRFFEPWGATFSRNRNTYFWPPPKKEEK